MRRIKLTQGYIALVDNEDYQRVVAAGAWQALVQKRGVYAQHSSRKHGSIRLHRFILRTTNPRVEVDHKDHNGLNCQRNNLRRGSRADNQHNSQRRCDNTSGYKGVVAFRGKWQARIRHNNARVFLGYYATKKEAALAYDKAAHRLFGKFANTNF